MKTSLCANVQLNRSNFDFNHKSSLTPFFHRALQLITIDKPILIDFPMEIDVNGTHTFFSLSIPIKCYRKSISIEDWYRLLLIVIDYRFIDWLHLEYCYHRCYFAFFCSDPAVKQFLLHLDEKVILGKKFVIEDLDETHLFVSAEIVPILQEKVWEIMDNNSFNIAQTNWNGTE